jgi:Mrp family chromosome partitioning ATPase
MTELLVGSTLPGLLAALDTALAGRKGLTTLTDGADIEQRLRDSRRPLDVLILDDTITPLAEKPALEDTLWHLLYLAGACRPAVRALLVVHAEAFPPQIRDSLVGGAREGGGDALVIPPSVGRQGDTHAVQWLTARLDFGAQPQQAMIMPLSGKGGSSKSTSMANIALALARRGYRTLIIDADFANGSLSGFFKVSESATNQSILTLNEEFPRPIAVYPAESIRRRIYQHPCGVDLLLSGRGLIEIEDLTTRAMQALLATVRQLPYDLVCLDAGPDIKARPYALDVLRGGGSGLVVCPPGRAERRGADNILALLHQMAAPGRNDSMLTQAAVLFVGAEQGSVAKIEDVQRDLMRRYPDATDLGIVPRDARVISMVAERESFCTVYDIDPRGRYAQALETACDRLIAHLRLPAPAAARNRHATPTSTIPTRGGLLRLLGIGRAAPAGEEQTVWS